MHSLHTLRKWTSLHCRTSSRCYLPTTEFFTSGIWRTNVIHPSKIYFIMWFFENPNPCSPLVTPICYSLYCRFLSNRQFLLSYEIRHSLCFPDSSPFFIIWGQLYSPNAYFQGNKPLWKKASNVGKWPKYDRLRELCIKPRLGLAVCAIIDLRVQLGGQRLCIHHKQSTHRLHKETINKWLWKCFVDHWFICCCFVKNIIWAQ